MSEFVYRRHITTILTGEIVIEWSADEKTKYVYLYVDSLSIGVFINH